LENKYVPICRREANRNRRYRTAVWTISRKPASLLSSVRLTPLTEQLNKSNTGHGEHTTKTRISHLLYVDNLKLVTKTKDELQKTDANRYNHQS
jgi:hypothetical protein